MCDASSIAPLIEKDRWIVNVVLHTDLFVSPALVTAAVNGCTNVVQLLLQNGAFIGARNSDDQTALMLAARGGYIDIIKMLLDDNYGTFGIDMINKRSGGTILRDGTHRPTALDFARETFRNKNEVISLLLRRGALTAKQFDDQMRKLGARFITVEGTKQ